MAVDAKDIRDSRGAGCFMRKLASIGCDSGTNFQDGVALKRAFAAQMCLLAEMTLEEMRVLDAEWKLPTLKIAWKDIQAIREVATAVHMGKPVPSVSCLVVEGWPVSNATPEDRDAATSLETELVAAWGEVVGGWKQLRLYKAIDCTSDLLSCFAQTLHWDGAGVLSIAFQRAIGNEPQPIYPWVVVQNGMGYI